MTRFGKSETVISDGMNKDLKRKELLTDLVCKRRTYYFPHLSYIHRKPYYEAVFSGDTAMIATLNKRADAYPDLLRRHSMPEDNVRYQISYECMCAAVELCLTAIQAGVPDMVAYDVRDEFMIDLGTKKSPYEISGLFCEIALEFATLVKYTRLRDSTSSATSRMMAYISEHIEEEISLQEVADAGGLSKNYACTRFRQDTGMNVRAFIMRERIGKARQLLAGSDMSSYEISRTLHFCSQSHFIQKFREASGMTPAEYRKMTRGQ